MRPPGRIETALASLAFAAAGFVGLVLIYAGPATYEDIATREALHRQIFFAPAKEAPRDAVEGTTYPLGTLVRLHEDTLAYVLGGAPTLPGSPTRGSFYSRAEAAHMADVRTVFALAKAGALTAAALLLLLAVRRRRDRKGLALLARAAAVGAAALVAVIALFAAVAFEPLFLLFHELFFPQGNFLFDPANSNMLKLYPEEYWQAVTLRVGITFLALAAAVAAAAQIALRRLAR